MPKPFQFRPQSELACLGCLIYPKSWNIEYLQNFFRDYSPFIWQQVCYKYHPIGIRVVADCGARYCRGDFSRCVLLASIFSSSFFVFVWFDLSTFMHGDGTLQQAGSNWMGCAAG